MAQAGWIDCGICGTERAGLVRPGESAWCVVCGSEWNGKRWTVSFLAQRLLEWDFQGLSYTRRKMQAAGAAPVRTGTEG